MDPDAASSWTIREPGDRVAGALAGGYDGPPNGRIWAFAFSHVIQ